MNSTASPAGSVVAVAGFAVPSYSCSRFSSVTVAVPLPMASVPVEEPSQFASFTVPVTA